MTCVTGCSRRLLIWEDTIIQQPRFHHRNFPSDQGLNDVISPPECPSSWGSHFQKFRDFGSEACSAEHVWLVEHFTSSILKHLQPYVLCSCASRHQRRFTEECKHQMDRQCRLYSCTKTMSENSCHFLLHLHNNLLDHIQSGKSRKHQTEGTFLVPWKVPGTKRFRSFQWKRCYWCRKRTRRAVFALCWNACRQLVSPDGDVL